MILKFLWNFKFLVVLNDEQWSGGLPFSGISAQRLSYQHVSLLVRLQMLEDVTRTKKETRKCQRRSEPTECDKVRGKTKEN